MGPEQCKKVSLLVGPWPSGPLPPQCEHSTGFSWIPAGTGKPAHHTLREDVWDRTLGWAGPKEAEKCFLRPEAGGGGRLQRMVSVGTHDSSEPTWRALAPSLPSLRPGLFTRGPAPPLVLWRKGDFPEHSPTSVLLIQAFSTAALLTFRITFCRGAVLSR